MTKYNYGLTAAALIKELVRKSPLWSSHTAVRLRRGWHGNRESHGSVTRDILAPTTKKPVEQLPEYLQIVELAKQEYDMTVLPARDTWRAIEAKARADFNAIERTARDKYRKTMVAAIRNAPIEQGE